MQDRAIFILSHAEARRRAVASVVAAPDGYSVTIKPQTRNSAQNALLHALLTDIAESVEWAGKKRDVETWKRLLIASWLRVKGESVELLPALDGHGVDIVFRRSSNLSKGEMADLIDYISAWAADNCPEKEEA